ncbi:MAG: bacterial Ig-like domain-containing protein [Candidatus Coprovivens sp.]
MRKLLFCQNTKYYFLLFVVLFSLINIFSFKSFTYSNSTNSEVITLTAVSGKIDVTLVSGVDLIPNKSDNTSAQTNTKNLQKAIDKVSESGGGIVYLPAGTFYFAQGGTANHGNPGEAYAIRCRNNVHIKGVGTSGSLMTILKPVYSSSGKGSMDMFYFNNYADTNYNNDGSVTTSTKKNVSYIDMNGNVQTLKNQTVYLINADFSDFIIDGSSVKGGTYNTTGKGFMINLFKDCDWNNIIVKNVDATGFGVDCPINSTITNCQAINCGKAATTSQEGASGFGIGTGYSNDESIIISNSIANNNKKFGFFFEHQARFSPNYYLATSSNGFVVANSSAGGNTYDFGGLKPYNVTYENVKSTSGTSSVNTLPIYFSKYAKDYHIANASFASYVSDISSNTTIDAWAINNGVLPLVSQTSFKPNNTITRFDVVKSLWNYNNLWNSNVEKVSISSTTSEIANNQSYIKNTIGFTDLGSTQYSGDLDSIIWAYKKGIIFGDTKFNPASNCTRGQFIVMLYRLANTPSVSGTLPFNDVSSSDYFYKAVLWGYNVGIVKGSTSNSFSPNDDITKNEVAIFLYRYHNLSSSVYKITYNLFGGTTSNVTSYKSTSSTITLSTPTRTGYTFVGWTGSNGSTPTKTVKIKTGTVGNLVYTANWKANLSSIEIKKEPNKLTYFVGDKVNTSGLVLNAIYTDNNFEEISSGYTISPTTLSSAGTQNITVAYNNKKTSFSVMVKKIEVSSISIKNKPTKLNYYIGDTINTSGMILTVEYNNGVVKDVSSGFSVSPTSFSTSGRQNVVVTYGGKSKSFEVNVLKAEIKSLSIKNLPKKTSYYVGDFLDTTGLVLSAMYDDGSIKDVTDGYIVSNTIFENSGYQKVTVSFASKSVSFDVEVKDVKTSSITINQLPYRTTYYVGDSFSSEGLIILDHKNSGFVEKVTDGFELSLDDGLILNEVGIKTVNVTYNNVKTSFNIEVVDIKNDSLIIISNPLKVNYLVGETFSLDGLRLQYIDLYNNRIDITSGYTTSIEEGNVLSDCGNIDVVVFYNNKQVSFNINVSEIIDIEVNEALLKDQYYVGDVLDSNSVVLIVTYQDSTREVISSGYDINIVNGTTFNTEGKNEVFVSYGGITTSFFVNVISKPLELVNDFEVNEDNKSYVKAKFDFEKICFIVVFIIIFIILSVIFVILLIRYIK